MQAYDEIFSNLLLLLQVVNLDLFKSWVLEYISSQDMHFIIQWISQQLYPLKRQYIA